MDFPSLIQLVQFAVALPLLYALFVLADVVGEWLRK